MTTTSSRPRSRSTDALAIAALVVATACVHGISAGGAFLNWDDDRFVTANPLFHGPTGDYVWAALTRVQFDAYHPLHLLSYLPDKLLWPDAPAGFHIVNILIFAADVALLYLLARRAGATAQGATIAAALFAVHPLVVEPVAWISARKDPLALLFFLGALLVEDRRPAAARTPSWKALALFVCALLTKTSTVPFPLVLAAWLLWMRGVPLARAALRAAPYAALSLATSIVVVTIWSDHAMIPPSRPHGALVDVASTVATYLRRVVWPMDLSPIYPAAAPSAPIAAAILGVVAVGLAVTWRRLPRAARYAAIAFAAAILPVANVVPVAFRFADRYALLALAVLVPAAALALRHRAATVAGALAAAALAYVTLAQHRPWHDSRALWAHAVSQHPDALMARLKHGETLRDAGRFADAVREYQAAIRLDEKNLLGWAGLFHLYSVQAEHTGQLPAGTAETWLRALGPAMADERAFVALLGAIPRDGCAPCSNTLLVMGLMRWPKPDAELLDAARLALEGGARDVALVYLSRIRERTAAVAEVEAAARR